MTQQKTIYEWIGGDEPLQELVNRFYDYMDELAEANVIRDLHPKNLSTSREKLYMFLSGWTGGPQRYMAAFGHPRLRARHLPFAIGEKERDQWMMCMQKALDDMEIDAAVKQHLLGAFLDLASHMINQPTPK